MIQADRWWQITIGKLRLSSAQGPRAFRAKCEAEEKLTANNLELEVYNLNAEERAYLESEGDLSVQIGAGYAEGEKGVVFLGQARFATSEHQRPNWVTKISAGDDESKLLTKGGYHAPKGTPWGRVLADLVAKLGIEPGNVSAFANTPRAGQVETLRAWHASGIIAREVQSLANAMGIEWSIQRGRFQGRLRAGAEGVSGYRITETIGTPVVTPPKKASPPEPLSVACRSLLLPALVPGSLYRLETPRYTGTLAATQVTTLLESRGAQWYTDVEGTPNAS